MKRRRFLKRAGAMSLLTLITPAGILKRRTVVDVQSDLEKSFMNPPWSARPHTWWHWMNGNVTKEGITLDLEAMAKIGLGGFQNFDAGTGIPKGPVQYLSDQWLDLKKHTIAEAARLGLEFTMHNCPGWSSSGGPWITPDLAMQEITWSEVVIEGGKKRLIKLPQPLTRLGHYRDISVIAYKSHPGELPPSSIKKVATNEAEISTALLAGLEKGSITVSPDDNYKKGFLQIDFLESRSIQQISFITSVKAGQRGPISLEISNDGINFSAVATISTGSGFGAPPGETLIVENFPVVSCRSIRLACDHSRDFMQVNFSDTPRAEEWKMRANFSFNRHGVNGIKSVPAISLDNVVDITTFLKPDGILDWHPREGNWTIMRFGYTPNGTLNRSAPDTGIGLECDKFSAHAIEFHFKNMMEKILQSISDLASKGRVGLLIDSYEVGMQNWTEGFERIFKERNHYDLTKYLPSITGRVVEDTKSTEGFLWDLRRTQGDLMAENYYGRFTALCHQHKIISYCQPYDRGPMEEMQIGSKVDANVGEFWNGLSSIFQNNWTMRRTVKLSASIAHTTGQQIVAAESYTGEPESSKWQEYPFALKVLGDKMFSQGLNRMVFHRFAHQPHPTAKPGMTMGPWGSHFDRTNTWWEAGRSWVDYISRCQHILQQGTFVADIAYFTGEDAGVYTRVDRDELKPDPPDGYDFDLINRETLLHSASVKDKKLFLKSGMSYSVLVLQDFKTMTFPLLKKIEAFVDQGLIVLGKRPDGSPGLNNRDELAFKKVADKLWVDDQGEREVGAGKVTWGVSLKEVFRKLNIDKDFAFTSRSGDAPIVHIHRRIDQMDFYFIANQRRTTEEIICEFRIDNKQPELWDPVSGRTEMINAFSSKEGKMFIPVTLREYGSAFIIFRNDPMGGQIVSIMRDKQTVLSTTPFDIKRKLFPDTKNTFSISCWVKPENHIMLNTNNFMDGQKPWTDYFAIYPSPGEKLYGSGHTTVGMAVGRNGVALWENSTGKPEFIFAVPVILSGWTHIVVTYRERHPTVYVNGENRGEGPASANTVHPGLGHTFLAEGASFYNGDVRYVELHDKALQKDQATAMMRTGSSMLRIDNTLLYTGGRCVFFEEGTYQIVRASGKTEVEKVKGQSKLDLSAAWKVSFPEGLGAPSSVAIEKLIPLDKHSDDGVKYFSGTCRYQREFKFDRKKNNFTRWYLDLGVVEILAEVIVNGKPLGILWTRPFVVDVTDVLVKGLNTVEISVTNLWPNRLIGDEQEAEPNKYAPGAGGSGFASLSGGAILELPEWYENGKHKPVDGRIAFATWKHYHKQSPLLQSGLIGPVVLRSGHSLVI